MVEKWSIPYPAYTGEEPRNVYVYLPDGMDGRERLPVLYMFDGHNVFFDEDATLSFFCNFFHPGIAIPALAC